MQAVIFGSGPMGRALAAACTERGDTARVLGSPGSDGHPPEVLAGAEVAFDASVGGSVRANVEAAIAAGCRTFVIATTGWNEQRALLSATLEDAGVTAVWAANFSLGTALFGRLVEEAAALYGHVEVFDPFIVEWHRRAKRDRPSGTARDLAARLAARSNASAVLEVVSVRAGSSPGMHLVGFDAPGETVELRITARDRSAYAAGALAAADWLRRDRRPPGLHPFDSVVAELVAGLTSSARGGQPSPPVRTRSISMTTSPARLPIRPARTTLRGAFTALVTPFTSDGSLDDVAFDRLLAVQLAAGIAGLVPCGTTGESPTLSEAERDRLIELTVAAAQRAGDSRPTVLAGTGTNDTAATIAATRRAAELGADAALVVAPYYNRPNQAMLAAHYTAVADEGGLPIVVYNVPSRTATNVDAATLLDLAAHPRIVGVKEASGNLDQIALICRDRPDGFAVLAGDDAWTLPVLALGGDGVVSVASNEVPGEMVALCAATDAGDWSTARHIHERLLPLFRANFAGAPNPAPLKAALAALGLIENRLRLPLLALDDAGTEAMAEALRAAGALPQRPLAASRA